MRKVVKISGLVLLVLLAGAAVAWFGFLRPEPPPVSPEDRAKIRVMPIPSELKTREGFCAIGEGVSYELKGAGSARLRRAVERFGSRLPAGKPGEKGPMLEVGCRKGGSDFPSLSDDESYSLKIRPGKILLDAPEEAGIIFGLETLLQLAEQNEDGWGFPLVTIEDRPRYPWRGLMIDVCRHWIPKEVILRNLDAMSSVKMNVLHWHLTEYQGFRVESRLYPRLHEMGSNGDYYSQDEIREVIDYAADRIRYS